MIDTHDQVSSVPAARKSRRSTTTANPAAVRAVKSSLLPHKTLRVQRIFSDAKVKPFDQVEWEKRTAEITDDAGKVIFKQENVEVPKSWSLLATKVVVSKYFYGEMHTAERETSVRQLIHRICRTIADWGIADGYFSKADGEVFYEELSWLCVNQCGARTSGGPLPRTRYVMPATVPSPWASLTDSSASPRETSARKLSSTGSICSRRSAMASAQAAST